MSQGRTAIIVICGLLSIVAGYFAKDSLAPQFHHVAPAAGERAKSLPVQNRDGSMRDLAKPAGKLFIVHFWATWCAPCVEEFPGLSEFAKTVKDDPDVELLAVSVDEDWKKVETWMAEKKLGEAVPMALDPKRETAKLFGTEKFPETWFLAASGKVLDRQIGVMDWGSEETRKRIQVYREAAKRS